MIIRSFSVICFKVCNDRKAIFMKSLTKRNLWYAVYYVCSYLSLFLYLAFLNAPESLRTLLVIASIACTFMAVFSCCRFISCHDLYRTENPLTEDQLKTYASWISVHKMWGWLIADLTSAGFASLWTRYALDHAYGNPLFFIGAAILISLLRFYEIHNFYIMRDIRDYVPKEQ